MNFRTEIIIDDLINYFEEDTDIEFSFLDDYEVKGKTLNIFFFNEHQVETSIVSIEDDEKGIKVSFFNNDEELEAYEPFKTIEKDFENRFGIQKEVELMVELGNNEPNLDIDGL